MFINELHQKTNNKENKLITHENLGSCMKNILKKNGLNFSKRDQCFLMSLFDKNNNNQLNIEKVKKVLFEDDFEDYFARKQLQPKGPFFEKPLNELKLTIQQKKDLKRIQKLEKNKIGKERSIFQKCRIKMQNSFIRNQRTNFQKWEYFDVNKDGFVGIRDVKNRLLEMRIFSSNELDYLIDHFSKI